MSYDIKSETTEIDFIHYISMSERFKNLCFLLGIEGRDLTFKYDIKKNVLQIRCKNKYVD